VTKGVQKLNQINQLINQRIYFWPYWRSCEHLLAVAY